MGAKHLHGSEKCPLPLIVWLYYTYSLTRLGSLSFWLQFRLHKMKSLHNLSAKVWFCECTAVCEVCLLCIHAFRIKALLHAIILNCPQPHRSIQFFLHVYQKTSLHKNSCLDFEQHCSTHVHFCCDVVYFLNGISFLNASCMLIYLFAWDSGLFLLEFSSLICLICFLWIYSLWGHCNCYNCFMNFSQAHETRRDLEWSFGIFKVAPSDVSWLIGCFPFVWQHQECLHGSGISFILILTVKAGLLGPLQESIKDVPLNLFLSWMHHTIRTVDQLASAREIKQSKSWIANNSIRRWMLSSHSTLCLPPTYRVIHWYRSI